MNIHVQQVLDDADEGRKGARYWFFTANELGMEDVAAQIDHLHIVKCAELRTAGAGFVAGPLANGFRRQAAALGAARRSASGCGTYSILQSHVLGPYTGPSWSVASFCLGKFDACRLQPHRAFITYCVDS